MTRFDHGQGLLQGGKALQPFPHGITQRQVEIVGAGAAHPATEAKEVGLGDALE